MVTALLYEDLEMKKMVGSMLFAVSLFIALPGCASQEAEVIEAEASELEALEKEMAADDAKIAEEMSKGLDQE